MGAAVSDWGLARAVSLEGQLGVVSGTALDTVLARRLQCGDPGGHMRRALDRFPMPGVAERILDRYFVDGGKADDAKFATVPMFALQPRQSHLELTVAGSFVEVFLAKEGHGGLVGINLLEKIQLPTLPALYGAMLAGVDVVLMGAGIPREIPGALDNLAAHREASLKLAIDPSATTLADARLRFDPRATFGDHLPSLTRPRFFAIIASVTLAQMLMKRSTGSIEGFVVEGPTAGGHNAPPRGKLELDAAGEPIYGPRDEVNLARIGALGLPFWLAGSRARASGLREAKELGAAGIQVGTVFAFCRESGLEGAIKQEILDRVRAGTAGVYTDPIASPTGFPFKVVQGLEDSLAEDETYQERRRVCDLGYLRTAYETDSGAVGFRCPAEPIEIWQKKGGDAEETAGRKCLCNSLLANVGLPQVRRFGALEKPLITAGDDLLHGVKRLLDIFGESYGAADVIGDLLGRALPKVPAAAPAPSAG